MKLCLRCGAPTEDDMDEHYEIPNECFGALKKQRDSLITALQQIAALQTERPKREDFGESLQDSFEYFRAVGQWQAGEIARAALPKEEENNEKV